MTLDLPPLNAVRTFEVAARHQSFSSAAHELGVTHGAVSRAVSGLESWLGVRLFRRAGRTVELTDEGHAYVMLVAPAFRQLAQGTALVRQRGAEALLVLAPPTLTVRWLIPRLPRFYERARSVEVRIRTVDDGEEGQAGEADVTIRRGPTRWRGSATRFLSEETTPVGAPALFRAQPVARPADLSRHTLIHAGTRLDAWSEWLRNFGVRKLEPVGELRFDHFYLALQAALDGLGVAMGPLPVIAEDLAGGRLVAPFADRVLATHHYVALTERKLGSEAPQVRAFVDWLVEEGGRTVEGARRRVGGRPPRVDGSG